MLSTLDTNDKSTKNFMDTEISFDSSINSKNVSSDSFTTNYSKQLVLLSEMGFTDTEFNHKTLKAANGNMQEALEIIVASNNKQRRKTNDRNIFDEIEEIKTSNSVQNASKSEQNIIFQSPSSIQMDDWGFENTSTRTVEHSVSEPIFNHEEVSKFNEPTPTPPVQNKQSNSHNPWDDNFIEEDSNVKKESKHTDDPFDTYKAFKSTADNFFDNPW